MTVRARSHAAHPLPSLRAVALLGATLLWFVVGLTAFMKERAWGFPVLLAYLTVEALFYGQTLLSGTSIFQVENHSDLIKAVFVIGYLSGVVAAYYVYRLIRHRLQAGYAARDSSVRELADSSTGGSL
jgi:hypothetical protein